MDYLAGNVQLVIAIFELNIFPNQKEAEINVVLQRFQLLLYVNYYIQFYCKTINS